MSNCKHKLLKIGCWNIQGLSEDKCQDTTVVEYIKKYDCAILIETWQNSYVNLCNQYTYCNIAKKSKHGRSKGGIVITMKNSVRRGVKILESYDGYMVWMKFVKEFFNLDRDLYICAIYIPPIDSSNNVLTKDKYELWDKLEESISKYSEYGHIMVMGDLNSRISNHDETLQDSREIDSLSGLDQNEYNGKRNSSDHVTNMFGRKLLDICRQCNLNILNGRALGDLQGQFTSFHYNGSSVIDYCIVNSEFYTKIVYFKVLDPTHVSDHASIAVCMNITNNIIPECNKQCYNKFPKGFKWNEDSYADALNLKQFKARIIMMCTTDYRNNTDGITSLCTELSSVITDAARCSLKRRKEPHIVKCNVRQAKWYNNNLYVLKNEVLHIGKLLKKYPKDPHIRGRFIVRKKYYKQACRKAKRAHMKSLAVELDRANVNNSKEFWRLLTLLKNKSYNDNSELPSMDKFVHFFKGLNDKCQGSNNFDCDFMNKIENIVKTQTYCEQIQSLDRPIDKKELDKVITNLRTGKAYGLDLITNEMLKKAVTSVWKPLLRLLNMCMYSEIYPEEWCQGYIIPIYKSGSKSEPANYRPITISSCLGKVFSSILNNRICSFLEDNNIMSNVQIGFLKGHRTSDHVLLLKAVIDAYKRRRKHIYSCFVDFTSAFDNVWHTGLVYKLRKSGISSKIISVLQSMYKNVQSCIRRENYVSDKFKCEKGTRQGCNLSPALFKIYLNDLQDIFNNKDCDSVKVGQQPLGCLMYADDVLLLSQSAKGLQNSLDKLNIYCKKWRLKINTTKTKTIIFNCRKSDHTFKLGNQILQDSDRVCYLGFMLTPSGKFKATQKYLYDKACRALFAQRMAISGLCMNYFSVNTQLKLFDATIKPILLYGSEVWGGYMYKFSNDERLIIRMLTDFNVLMEKLHSRYCKLILRVNKNANNYAVRCELGRYPLIIEVMCKLLKYYVNICKRNNHSIVKTALQLHMSNTGSWFSFVEHILKILCIDINKLTKSAINTGKNSIRNKLYTMCQNIYINKLVEFNKLKLYSSIKTKFRREPYLTNIHDVLYRKLISQLRMSCHKLPVELGRYQGVKFENRLCKLCKGSTGTVKHCIMECFHPDVVKLRNIYINKIYSVNSGLCTLSRENLFVYIMLFIDTVILSETVKFVYEVYNLHLN
jgi:exonuclease III